MTKRARGKRLQFLLDEAVLAAVDEWRFEHRMPNRSSAIRHLLQLGLKARWTAGFLQSKRRKKLGAPKKPRPD